MTLEIYHSLALISREDWQKIVPAQFPFASYDFLSALETSNCLGSRTGWAPAYLVVTDELGLAAVLISFVKNNSYGEYIFDFAWAEAHQSLKIPYYPKLVSAIPFTPATGPKLLFAERLSAEEKAKAADLLIAGNEQLGEKINASSTHALFITQDEIPYYKSRQHFIRYSFQFHWKNQGYKTFDDFLQSLRGKRRREILRERAQVYNKSLTITRLTGNELKPEHAKIMYDFYLSTIDKMNGMNYLTQDFFTKVFATMKEQILFVLATNQHGLPVAGAFNIFGINTLFGRQWGCLEEYKSLHFELCYYQGIEFAIEKKFTLFEAGAQGEHKFQRGFLPALTYSAHQIRNPQMDVAIRNHVEYEKDQIDALFADYGEHTPFSRQP